MNMTLTDVADGVRTALAGLYPSISRYGEEDSALEAPCFFVKQLPSSQDRLTGRRYLRRQSFDVHYFPDPGGVGEGEGMLEVAERLYEGLEQIMANGIPVRGSDTRHEIVAGVLHFFVSYRMHMLRELAPATPMNELDQEVGLK